MLAGDDAHASSDGGAIALCSDQFDLDPILLVAAVIAKKRRRVVHIKNQGIDVAIVVIVAERGAAAGETLADAGSHLGRNVFESPITQVFVYQTRVLVGLAGIVPLNLRVHVPIDLQDVGPAIIVKLNETAAQGDLLILDAD